MDGTTLGPRPDAPIPEADEIARVCQDAIEGLPDGVIVVDRFGKLLFANRALKLLVGKSSASDWHRRTCCDVFGCKLPETGLQKLCLTQECLASGPLPEVRVELPASDPTVAVWVKATRLVGSDDRVLFRVRGCRPVEGLELDTHPTLGPRLGILVLGRTKLDAPCGPVTGGWLDQREGQLLKYLVCERHRVVQTEEIADELWPGAGERGPSLVRHYIHGLRNRLEPRRPKRSPSSFVLLVAPGGYALNRELVRVDADAFETLASNGLARTESDPQDAAETLERALTWYRGELMSELPYAVWTLAERERLRDLALRALRRLARLFAADGDVDAACSYLQKAAEMQPFDTDIERELITLALANGRHSTAMRRYNALRTRMLRRFGEEPEFRLSELMRGTSPR